MNNNIMKLVVMIALGLSVVSASQVVADVAENTETTGVKVNILIQVGEALYPMEPVRSDISITDLRRMVSENLAKQGVLNTNTEDFRLSYGSAVLQDDEMLSKGLLKKMFPDMKFYSTVLQFQRKEAHPSN